MLAIVYCNLFCLIYIGYIRPIDTRLKNNIENFNEFLVSCATYHMFFFTDWVFDKDVQFMYGFSLVYFVYFTIAFNMVFVVHFSVYGLWILS